MNELRALTGLRFIAALYVLLFHFYKRGLLPPLPVGLTRVVAQGALGVNLFFVLSGLLLTYSHLRDFPEAQWPSGSYYRRFVLKRLARLYPVFLAGLGVTTLSTWILQSQPPRWALLLALNLTLTHVWLPPLSMEWYGSGSWSVAVELFFYLLFPLLLPLFLRIRQARTLLVLLGALWLASCGPGLFFAKYPALPLFRWVYAFPPARLPEFCSGIVAGLLAFRWGWRVPGWAVVGAWALVVAYLLRFGWRFEGYVAHNVLVLPALVLTVMYLGRAESGLAMRLLGSRLLTYLGRISYGFYIWQLMFFEICDPLWERNVLHRQAPGTSWVSTGLITLSAILSFHLLEQPARQALRQRFRPGPNSALRLQPEAS